ncbi:GerMN domain-containing protein [Christensenellaceae bacterium OttesenSCG-928-L17]|nr:GerMN domain-containing protein [Christensenellaceae bacterium OttesenSCG-928-L17]
MMKKRLLTLATAAILVCVSLWIPACSPQADYPPAIVPTITTPPAIETGAARSISVELYFRAGGDGALMPETRTVLCELNTHRAEAAVHALCGGPTDPVYTAVVPEGWTLTGVEQSGDICHVYFQSETAATEEELLILRAALAATVSKNGGSAYVNVFLNDMQPGYLDRPLGAQASVLEALDTYLAQYAANINANANNLDTDALIENNVELYFADTSRTLLLCDVRTLRYDSEADIVSIASSLLDELSKGPVNSEGREPVLPVDMRLLRTRHIAPDPVTDPAVDTPDATIPEVGANPTEAPTTEGGETPARSPAPGGGMLQLYFLNAASLADENERTLVFASLVHTLTSFLPNISEVEINLLNPAIQNERPELQTHIATLEQYIEYTERYTRADFKDALGQNVPLHFPLKDGTELSIVQRCLPQAAANSALCRLQSLFDGNANTGVDLTFLVPEDILSVTQSGENMLIVNFAPGFVEKLRAFSASGDTPLPGDTRTKMAVFSMINTLCEFPWISRVLFLEDGRQITETIDNIYFGNPLYYNPGLTAS